VAPQTPSTPTRSASKTENHPAERKYLRDATALALETPEPERTRLQARLVEVHEEQAQRCRDTEQAIAKAKQLAASGASQAAIAEPLYRLAEKQDEPIAVIEMIYTANRMLGPWPEQEAKQAATAFLTAVQRRVKRNETRAAQIGRVLARATIARRNSHRSDLGRTPRQGTNTRQRGSRREGASSSTSSADPGEPHEPAPAHGRFCKNSAHDPHRWSSDPFLSGNLDALGIEGDYCHGNCKQQAYRIRCGATPRRLTSAPFGWSAPAFRRSLRRAAECGCANPLLTWQSKTEARCFWCGKPVAGLTGTAPPQVEGITSSIAGVAPQFRSVSYVALSNHRHPWEGEDGRQPITYLLEREDQRKIEAEIDTAISQYEVPVPADADVAAAAEAFELSTTEAVA